MPLYRDIKTDAPEYEPLPFYTSEVEEEMDLATWLREAPDALDRTSPDVLISEIGMPVRVAIGAHE